MFSIYNNAWLTFELVKLFSLIIFFVYDLQISQNQQCLCCSGVAVCLTSESSRLAMAKGSEAHRLAG